MTRFAKALFGQVGDQVDQVDQVGQGQGQELDNIAVKLSMNMHDVLPVYMYRIAKHKVVQKFPIKASTTIGQLEG